MLEVLVCPRSSRNEIVGPFRDRLKIAVTAPPVDDKANLELLKLMAGVLRLPKGRMQIVRGQKAREKTIEISCDIRSLRMRLLEHLGAGD